MWCIQLKQHLLESHNEGSWLVCNICQKKFVSSGNLNVHVRRHKGVKPYVCSDCPKRFCGAGGLKSHQLIHSDVKGFGCGLCAKGFKRKDSVSRHVNRCVLSLATAMCNTCTEYYFTFITWLVVTV